MLLFFNIKSTIIDYQSINPTINQCDSSCSSFNNFRSINHSNFSSGNSKTDYKNINHDQSLYQKQQQQADQDSGKCCLLLPIINYIRKLCLSPSSFSSSTPIDSSIIITFFQSLFPIICWLPNYNIRSDLLPDLVTGFTILALHIPQGLAYGQLAGVNTINGLYVSFFPVLIYALFGGSRHISVGTFAVISIACKDVLDSLAQQGIVVLNDHNNHYYDNNNLGMGVIHVCVFYGSFR